MITFDFDSSGFDDLIDNLQYFEIDCPECEQSFEISLEDIGNEVKCALGASASICRIKSVFASLVNKRMSGRSICFRIATMFLISASFFSSKFSMQTSPFCYNVVADCKSPLNRQ